MSGLVPRDTTPSGHIGPSGIVQHHKKPDGDRPLGFDRAPLEARLADVAVELGEVVSALRGVVHDDVTAIDLESVADEADAALTFYRALFVELARAVERAPEARAEQHLRAVEDRYQQLRDLVVIVRSLKRTAQPPRPPVTNPAPDEVDATKIEKQQEAARMLQRQWRLSRRMGSTIDHGHIYRTTVTGQRGAALARTHGDGHLADEYGLRSVRNLTPNPDLVFGHDSTPKYMRDQPDRMYAPMKALLQSRGYDPNQLSKGLYIINSPLVVDKLKFFLASKRNSIVPSRIFGSNFKVDKLADHLYVLEIKSWGAKEVPDLWGTPGVTELPADVLESLLLKIGAYPSQFEVLKALGTPQASTTRVDIDNAASLAGLLAAAPFQRLAQLGNASDHPLASVVGSAIHLIQGMQSFQHLPSFAHDALVADALRAIGNLLAAMASSLDNTERATRLYDLVIEELHLILATARPYTQRASYEAAVHAVQDERAPSSAHPGWNRRSHLAASGMDAITTALIAANKSHKHTGIEMPERAKGTDYFEIQPTIDYRGKIEDHGNVVVCGLNPSTPVQRPDHAALIALIQRKLEDKKRFAQVSLVIDNTIEIDGGDHGQLETILQALARPISEGRLQILLAKSYQKYASHGTGKVMAGNVTQIHAGKQFGETSRFIDKADRANNYTLDEAQLMTHMVAHGHRDELGLIQHAADNADRLDQIWPGDHDPVAAPHQRGLPFVLRGMVPLQFEGPRPKSADAVDAAMMLGAEFRDSFGFQNTSVLGVIGPDGPNDKRLRINPGQESAGELTEKLYALGQLVSSKQREQASTGGSGALKIGMPDVMERIHAEISQFRRLGLDVTANGNYAAIFRMVHAVVAHNGDDSGFASKIASFLHLAATLLVPTGADAQPLLRALSGFLASEPSGLSPAMTRQLAVDLLKLTLVDLAAIAAHLPAILDAARRVPPHVGLKLFLQLREPIFAQLGDDVRRALTTRLLDHLDPVVLVELLNRIHAAQPTKATSLRHQLDTDLAKPTALDDGGGLFAPDVTAAMTTVSRDTTLSLGSTGTYQLE